MDENISTNNQYKRLGVDFYQHHDVCEVAKRLLGKVIVSQINGFLTSGIIVETEAYSYKEKACHAYMNKNTNRTRVLFDQPGTAYVYLCYGIHKLLNVVTNTQGIAEAVLIRAIEPLEGLDYMLERRKFEKVNYNLCSGPGKLSQAMGITTDHNRISLLDDILWIEERVSTQHVIESSPRIGVGYAEEDALLPWRFTVSENPWISKGNNSYPDVFSS